MRQFIVEDSGTGRLRYRVRIVDGPRELFAVRASAAWPGAGAHAFCLRDTGPAAGETLVEVERVPVVEFRQHGRKFSFSLDRPTRKRAEFLVVVKGYKNREGAYEQIYFRTEAAIHAHRSRGMPALHGSVGLHVVIDSREKYPWTFPGALAVERRPLPAGDYALLHGERIVAVVERKTFPNLLTDIYSAQVLRNKFSELAAYGRAAIVVEAQYGDLTNRERLPPKCSPSHLARMVGEFAATHPTVPLVWAGNRKYANAWTAQFFVAAARAAQLFVPDALADLVGEEPLPVADGGVDQALRRAVKQEIAGDFTVAQLVAAVPGADAERARRVLTSLRDQGLVERRGHARGARWRRIAVQTD